MCDIIIYLNDWYNHFILNSFDLKTRLNPCLNRNMIIFSIYYKQNSFLYLT